jgi:hypothetical protein
MYAWISEDYRLLKLCYVPATSAGLPRLLFFKQTRHAVCTIKQSIYLDVSGFCRQNLSKCRCHFVVYETSFFDNWNEVTDKVLLWAYSTYYLKKLVHDLSPDSWDTVRCGISCCVWRWKISWSMSDMCGERALVHLKCNFMTNLFAKNINLLNEAISLTRCQHLFRL